MENIYYLFSVKDRYFTDLSLRLKTKDSSYSYYGLAYAKNSFLKNSIYKNISYVSDIIDKTGNVDYAFLDKVEKQYNINLANMIHADRHLMRYKKNKRLFITQELLKLFIREMQEFNISMLLAEAVDDFISYFAAYYCQHHRIYFFYATYVGYGERACLSSSIDAVPNGFENQFINNLETVRNGKVNTLLIEETLQKYVSSRKKPSYFTLGNPDYKPFRWIDIKTFFQYLVSYTLDRRGMHYDRFPLLTPLYRLQRIFRQKAYRKFLAEVGFKPKNLDQVNYLIYPLHFEPEASTLIQGRWFNDQKKLIEIISKNLPANTILLVKEHKASVGRRGLEFYKDITRYHNVFLIDDVIDSFQLIENSKGVIVISSTMGLEALMLKKPVMIFGERFYNVSNNVYCVENYKKIDQTIAQLLSHQFDWLDTIAIFYTLFLTTKDLGCLSHVEYSEKDLDLLADEIIYIFLNQISVSTG